MLVIALLGALPKATRAQPAPPLHPVVPDAGQLWRQGQPFEVRGVNYIHFTGSPAGCPELHFGADARCPWDQGAIEADMARLQALGVNSIRIFLNYYVFGGARAADPTYSMARPLANLDALIASAGRHGIYVMPVLLAKFPQDQLTAEGYAQAAELHVRPVLRHLAARPGILAWDLFNEPDIGSPIDLRCWDWDNGDFPLCRVLAEQRLAFLSQLSADVRSLDVGRPITIGMAFAKSYFRPPGLPGNLADLVDIYSFHYYDDDPYDSGRYAAHWYYGAGFPADLRRGINELTTMPVRKPVLVTEIGFPTGTGALRDEVALRRDLALGLATARTSEAAGVMLWPFQEPHELLVGNLFFE
jgi:endo-1,4-beta-mannosidase